MTAKAVLDAALKLPKRSRARLVEKLLDSLDELEGIDEDALREGAKIAERRLRDLRTGKTKAIPGDQVHREIFGRP